MNEMPAKVKAAFNAARAAGVPFPENYTPPYYIHSVSTMGKDPWDFTWEEGEHPYEPDSPDAWEKKMGRAGQFAYTIAVGEHRFTGFYLNKEKVINYRDFLNIRHFNIAALSDNPKIPVLI